MSRKLLAFLLSELHTARLICKNKSCGAVTEMSLERMGDRFGADPTCPVCRERLVADPDEPLYQLVKAIRSLKSQKDRVEIEFVLPDPAVD